MGHDQKNSLGGGGELAEKDPGKFLWSIESPPQVNEGNKSVVVTSTMFKLTGWSSLVVPHAQDQLVLCRLHSLVAILDSMVTQQSL